jgi:hypothetical protein
MERHPITQYWKRYLASLVTAVVIFAVFLGSHSYLLAIGTILVFGVGYTIYLTGEASNLPGTAGKKNKNVPT